MSKRAFKLQEFVAHSGNVCCLKLGRKSGQLLVTGGEDKKVNIWQIGKPHAIHSLTGHQSTVECVAFDVQEEVVVAGSQGGTLKLWDLTEGKAVRTMTAHKANCIAVDFHPFGEFFASGAVDAQLKIWDIRRRACIQTYKGHTKAVSAVKFSPDGKWIVSGGEDGSVKLWDLTAGKLLTEFNQHTAAVTSVDFHPIDFLLSSSSDDHTVRLWDLDEFKPLGCSDHDIARIRLATFAPDGKTLFAATPDALKVYSWAPFKILDTVNVGWNRVADMSISDNNLNCCSFAQTFVTAWVVDLESVKPYYTGGDVADDVFTPVVVQQPVAPAQPVVMQAAPQQLPRRKSTPTAALAPVSAAVAPSVATAAPAQAVPSAVPSYRRPSPPHTDNTPAQPVVTAPVSRPAALPRTTSGQRPTPVAVAASAGGRKPATIATPTSDKPVGFDLSAFLPVRNGPTVQMTSRSRPQSESDVITAIQGDSRNMKITLTNRLTTLRAIRSMWAQDDVRSAVQHVAAAKDPAVIADFLSIIAHRSGLLTLDMAVMLLPSLTQLLTSGFDSFVIAALNGICMLLKVFGGTVATNMAAAGRGMGVDLAQEDRMQKCQQIFEQFSKARRFVADEAAGRRQNVITAMTDLSRTFDTTFPS
eukprot:TRINITY_DN1752_c0_g1_i1.p1 TRINITY_DN1752_c0_g1~~TRINITY_DN1752_c0_g1_i1.p1  ORF type:complete len:641 (+),score=156.10 TRINITY_DN1752_c0_g1_i1:23-1945(+)